MQRAQPGWDERTERGGWCLGVLAAALGVDCLLERREPRGLAWMMTAVARARGLELSPDEGELPELAPGTSSWELPLLAGCCVQRARPTAAGNVAWSARRTQASWILGVDVEADESKLGERRVLLDPEKDGQPGLTREAGRLELHWS